MQYPNNDEDELQYRIFGESFNAYQEYQTEVCIASSETQRKWVNTYLFCKRMLQGCIA